MEEKSHIWYTSRPFGRDPRWILLRYGEMTNEELIEALETIGWKSERIMFLGNTCICFDEEGVQTPSPIMLVRPKDSSMDIWE